MQKDALALILLLGVLVLGMVGAALWLSGSNRRAALAARGRDEGGGSAIRAALERIDGALRRTRQGQRLAQWLRSSGGPLSPIDAVAIVASTRRETFRLGTVARFEADPIGPDRRVTGRFRHFPLPPAIHRRLELMGLEIPVEFGPEAELEQTPVRTAE